MWLFFTILLACRSPVETDLDSAEPEATYVAQGLATALDRIAVTRTDEAGCAVFVLVSPSEVGQWPVSCPEGWSVERGGRSARPEGCDVFDSGPDFQEATSISGVVLMPSGAGQWPRTVDFDVLVGVDGLEIALQATGVVVDAP